MRGVKRICFLTALCGLCLALVACNNMEPQATNVGQRLQDGLQGRGTIVPNNPTENSFGSDFR